MGHVLFRLVSVLGGGSSLVGGRVQFSSLLLRIDQTNTYVLVEASGRVTRKEALLILKYLWYSFSQDGYWAGFQ